MPLHTVGAAPKLVPVVGVTNRDGNKTVTGVTYGGTPPTRIGFRNGHGNVNRIEIRSLTAPSPGTANVVVSPLGIGGRGRRRDLVQRRESDHAVRHLRVGPGDERVAKRDSLECGRAGRARYSRHRRGCGSASAGAGQTVRGGFDLFSTPRGIGESLGDGRFFEVAPCRLTIRPRGAMTCPPSWPPPRPHIRLRSLEPLPNGRRLSRTGLTDSRRQTLQRGARRSQGQHQGAWRRARHPCTAPLLPCRIVRGAPLMG